MSTRYTKRGVPLEASQTLRLIQGAARLNDVITHYLADRLAHKGHTSVTPSLLSFLSVLECGVNFGSEIARNLNVSRQMVAKTVKVLCGLGYLEQRDGAGKQKEIFFTEAGEYLISDTRALLAEVDSIIFDGSDIESPNKINTALEIMANKIEAVTLSI